MFFLGNFLRFLEKTSTTKNEYSKITESSSRNVEWRYPRWGRMEPNEMYRWKNTSFCFLHVCVLCAIEDICNILNAAANYCLSFGVLPTAKWTAPGLLKNIQSRKTQIYEFNYLFSCCFFLLGSVCPMQTSMNFIFIAWTKLDEEIGSNVSGKTVWLS